MLKISAYTVSNENLDETIPSPLVDGDAPAVVPEMPVESAPAELQPIEQSVVLPPHLDPTPVDPLSADIIQEEVIAENLETEAGQLMGASIALEGYAQLLKSSGKNMTRQSAAFMAVGMRRANRLLPGASLGLEDEESGTQVMAMQQSKVDEKGLGAKLKEGAAKVWEWLLKQIEKLKAQMVKLRAFFSKEKVKIEYLLGFAGAVESGSPAKLKALEAPAGLKTATLAENVESFEKPSGKSIRLSPGEVSLFVSGGKLDLSLAGALQLAKTELPAYIAKATTYGVANAKINSELTESSTPEETVAKLEEGVKTTVGADPVEIKVTEHAVYTRNAEGFVKFDSGEGEGTDEVALPDVAAIKQFLAHLQEIIKVENSTDAAVNKMLDAITSVSQTRDAISNRIGDDLTHSILVKVMAFHRRPNFETCGNVETIKRILSVVTKNGVALADKLLAAHAGHDGTISQEDFTALPSRGLSVIPGQTAGGPGLMQRGAAMAKDAWRKVKEFFIRLWQQITETAKRMWGMLFGTEKQAETLLLVNNYVPEDGQAPTGEPPALPPGTGLKSVAATRALPAPGSAPVEQMPEEAMAPAEPQGVQVPPGHVLTPRSATLRLSTGFAIDPSIEEAWITWLTRSYVPALTKFWRDLNSLVNTDIDPSDLATLQKTVGTMFDRLTTGAPVGEFPGGETIAILPGKPNFQFTSDGAAEATPVKMVNKRQIEQSLSRQNKALKALLMAERVYTDNDNFRRQFEALVDRRIDSSDDTVADQWADFYTFVNRAMGNLAFNQLLSRIKGTFSARIELFDEMIAARAKGKK